jgi:glycine/D-amino acid oxidase-like deaminating enzyme
MSHVVVIGAGITGTTTAYGLLEDGYSVTLIERHHYPGMETSYANGGQLSASNAEVWNNWSTIVKGMKWMLRPDAPLLVNPMPTLHKYAWFAEFCGNMRHHHRNTVATTRLAIAARERRGRRARQSAAEGRGARPARRHTGRNARHRTHVDGRLLRWLFHTLGFHRRHS